MNCNRRHVGRASSRDINTAAVLGTCVIALTVQTGGIVNLEKISNMLSQSD
jgi:hypothetical protein